MSEKKILSSKDKTVTSIIAADEISHPELYKPVLHSLIFHLQNEKEIEFPKYLFSAETSEAFGKLRERDEYVNYPYSLDLSQDLCNLTITKFLQREEQEDCPFLPIYSLGKKGLEYGDSFKKRFDKRAEIPYIKLKNYVGRALESEESLVKDSYRQYSNNLSSWLSSQNIKVEENISEEIENREIKGDKVSVNLPKLQKGTFYVFELKGKKFGIEKLSDGRVNYSRLIEK